MLSSSFILRLIALFLFLSVHTIPALAFAEAPVLCDSDSASLPPLRVAVIGAGPSGLFFCHAVEKILQQQRMAECNNRIVEVTAFERSSHPGGLWQNKNENSDVSIYDNMWTNGPSFLHEFYDYTYDEHFGRPVDLFMPRQDVLEYILARVQKNSTDFFEKYVQFDTEVVNVRYIDSKQVFEVTTADVSTGVVTKKIFDKCVWAAGENGKASMPSELVEKLKEGGYEGRVIHSSDMSQFENDVRGKRIVLVGSSASAEDLALQAIKCGVEKVYVAMRSVPPFDYDYMSFSGAWPVEILAEKQLTGTSEDGNSIFLEGVKYLVGVG